MSTRRAELVPLKYLPGVLFQKARSCLPFSAAALRGVFAFWDGALRFQKQEKVWTRLDGCWRPDLVGFRLSLAAALCVGPAGTGGRMADGRWQMVGEAQGAKSQARSGEGEWQGTEADGGDAS